MTAEARDDAGQGARPKNAFVASHQAVVITAGGATGGQRVTFRWSDRDPYAVVMTIGRGQDEQVWEFAREYLVHDGGTAAGDVQVEHLEHAVKIVLDSPEGHAEVHVRRATVEAFVKEMLTGCPLREERAVFVGDSSTWVDQMLDTMGMGQE